MELVRVVRVVHRIHAVAPAFVLLLAALWLVLLVARIEAGQPIPRWPALVAATSLWMAFGPRLLGGRA